MDNFPELAIQGFRFLQKNWCLPRAHPLQVHYKKYSIDGATDLFVNRSL